MSRIIYMVELDQQRKIGSVLFDSAETAKLYATECQLQGLSPIVVPRVLNLETAAEWGFSNEVKLAK